MNKIYGLFGMQGVGKTTWAINYIKNALKAQEYFSIWIFSPAIIQDENDLFIQNFGEKFEINKAYRYAIFKILDIDRSLLLRYQQFQEKKLLVIDEVDLFFNISSKKEDFLLLTTLRNNNSDMIFISKRIKRIPLLMLQMCTNFVFFRYNLIDDLKNLKDFFDIDIELISNLQPFQYVEYKTF